MKKECFQSLPKVKDLKNQAYNLYIQQALDLLAAIQALNLPKNPNMLQQYKNKSNQLWNFIKRAKGIKQLKKDHATQIYNFFLKEQLRTLYSIKGYTDNNIKIVKSTKGRLNWPNKSEKKDDNANRVEVSIGELDWKQIWERICEECPEVGYNSNSIQKFIQAIKKHFNENNAIEVWQYFRKSNHQGMERKMVRIFTNITKNTSNQILQQYILNLLSYYKLQKINKTQFIVLFVAATKVKRINVEDQKNLHFCQNIFKELNQAMMESFTSLTYDKKKGTQNLRINSSSAILLQSLIGKCNMEGSLQFLDHVFYFVSKILKPLESSQCVSFLYIFFKYLERRLQKEKKTREKLEKLEKKIEESKEKGKENEEEEEEEEQQEGEQKNGDEQQPQTDILGDLVTQGFAFEEEEEEEDADLLIGTDQEKLKKFKLQLSHEITHEMIDLIEKHLNDGLFSIIYYVSSKKTIPHLLKYIYRIFPSMSIKSLDILELAGQIPNINEQALIKNMIIGVQGMFAQNSLNPKTTSAQNYVQAVRNIMRILEKAFNTRSILDVWPIYQSITSKVPLIDEKDAAKIDDKEKDLFMQKFGLNHDRFYEEYSEHVLEAFKRLLREGQFVQNKDHKKYVHSLSQIFYNSYPEMKKRFLGQVMEVIADKPNDFIFKYFLESDLPKKEEEILRNQLELLNQESEHTKELRQNFVATLAKNFTLPELKVWVRKMASDNFYSPLRRYLVFRVRENLSMEPLPSSLNYLYSDFKAKLLFNNSVDKIKENLKEMNFYMSELLEQLTEILKKIEIGKQEQDFIDEIVDTYNNSDKIKAHGSRKSIFELLNIIQIINSSLELSIMNFKSKKIEVLPSEVQTLYLIQNQSMEGNKKKILQTLLSHREILNDPNIAKVLTTIIGNQYFLYDDIVTEETKRVDRNMIKNKNHEVPGSVNRIRYFIEYISRARMIVAANTNAQNLLKTKKLSQEQSTLIFKLLSINGNEGIQDLMNIFKETDGLDILKELTLRLMDKKVENRLLIKKISDILQFLGKNEVQFTNGQIQSMMDYHVKFLQSHDSKIREHGNKSIKKMTKILSSHPISNQLHEIMKKYLKIEKMEMIWLIYVIVILGKPECREDPIIAEKIINNFQPSLSLLLLDESRSIRRISMYVYSVLIRKIKKIKSKHTLKKFETDIPQKKFEQFIETGFLLPQFYENQLKDKQKHIKFPFSDFKQKNLMDFEYNYFDFLINDEQTATKFIKNFHSDMVASTEMLASALQSSMLTIDLFSAATKALENVFFFMKTRDMSSSRVQIAIGARFFKYLCMEDARKGYKFFKSIKEEVIGCLNNLENLDNQTLTLIYSASLLNAYENNYTEKNEEIEKFLFLIFKQIIDKSSGTIFKKFLKLFFDKYHSKGPISFFLNHLEKMIAQKSKVLRCSQILLKFELTGRKKLSQIFQFSLANRLELENPSFGGILCDLLLFPDSYPFKIEDLQKTKVIDVEEALKEKKVIKVSEDYILFSMKSTHKFIISQISRMIEGEATQQIKTASNLIVKIFEVFTSMIKSDQAIDFLIEIIKLGIQLTNSRKQLQLDNYEQFIKLLTKILSSQKYRPQNFKRICQSVLPLVQNNKKGLDILKALIASPTNIIGIQKDLVSEFLSKSIEFDNNSSLFKEILSFLSTIFFFSKTSKEEFESLLKILSTGTTKAEIKKNEILLMQGYLLAHNKELDPKYVKEILRGSSGTKDRRNIWAREMMLSRGRREYFDDESTYEIWKEIKEISNPYHYIA